MAEVRTMTEVFHKTAECDRQKAEHRPYHLMDGKTQPYPRRSTYLDKTRRERDAPRLPHV